MISIHTLAADQIWSGAGEFLIRSLETHQNEKTLLLLSGGSVVKLYESIKYYVSTIEYGKLAFAQIDERFQPENGEDINAGVIGKTGLWEACGKKKIPYYLIPQEGTLEEAAIKYNQIVKNLFEHATYKIGVLGIGEDGHTAGLLPGYGKAWNADNLAVGYQNNGKYPMRISVTPKALQMLDQVLLVAGGEGKSEAVRNALDEANLERLDQYPAAILQRIKKADLFTDILGLPRRPASQRGEQAGLTNSLKGIK